MKRVRHGLVFLLVSLFAVPAAADTIVNLGTVTRFTGGDPGEGLDLTGNFVYGIGVGSTVNNTLPTANAGSPFTFIGDAAGPPIVGYTNTFNNLIAGDGTAGGWSTKPSYGASLNDDQLEDTMHPIRWSSQAASTVTLAVTPGKSYKLQTLISATNPETRGWDIGFDVDGAGGAAQSFAVDNIFSNGVDPPGGGVNPGPGGSTAPGVVWTHEFTATAATASFSFNQDSVFAGSGGTAFGGGDPNAILSGITLEELAIPEPSSWAIFLIVGAVACGAYRWLRIGRKT